MIIGYGAYGQPPGGCPGNEVWDDSIGACVCPPGTVFSGTVGTCVPEGQPTQMPPTCPAYTKVTKGCLCPEGHAYDPAKQMCTKEAFGPQPAPTTQAPSPEPGGFKLAGLGVGGWLLIAAAAAGVAYLAGAQDTSPRR